MTAGQQGRAALRRSIEPTPRGRVGDGASRRTGRAGPAFISDEAEEQHYHEVLHDPRADHAARAAARLELAKLYERHGHLAEAVEMYERNVWAGVRTPATYAGLAAAYRAQGRDDLADAALEQVRREGGAGRTPASATTTRVNGTARLPRRPSRARSTADGVRHAGGAAGTTSRSMARGRVETPATGSAFDQLRRSAAPLLEGQTGRRALMLSGGLLPIVLGLGIFAAVVFSSTRGRSAEPAPTPAPVATVAPTPAPTVAPASAVPPALAQPPAPARLVISNVGPDGLSLRRSPSTTGQRIKIWSDGIEMADLGETAEGGGKSWRKVRDPDGNVGWVAAEFLTDPAARASAPAAPAFASGGLGLTRAEWEKTHGQPSQSSIFLEYAGGRLVVGLLEGNIWHIERVWMRGDAVSLENARNEARAFLPADAEQVQSFDRGDGRVVDVYRSASLNGRFSSTAWNGGKAGTFSIQYRFRSAADRLVTSAMFRLGDAQF